MSAQFAWRVVAFFSAGRFGIILRRINSRALHGGLTFLFPFFHTIATFTFYALSGDISFWHFG